SKIQLDGGLLLLFAMQSVLYAAWNTASWPLMSANRPQAVTRWSLANAVLTIVSSYVAIRLGGGLRTVAAVGFAADILCGLAPLPLAGAAFLGQSPRRFLADLLRALACAAPIAGVAYLCLVALQDDVLRLVAFSAGSLALLWPATHSLLGRKNVTRILGLVFR